MKLIILGLKERKTGKVFVYDTVNRTNHAALCANEPTTIACLDPFPFSNFSSLDEFNEKRFEKCYLEVEGELSKTEFHSMKSSGIVYHQFFNRQVTLLNEFEDIFQYSLEMLKKFDKQLGTYDLTTWVLHNEVKNEAEFLAAKSIITKAVQKKENKQYPLDISLDHYTVMYMDIFRELSERTYNITFGRYGTCDHDLFKNENITFSNETFLYVMKHVRLYEYSYIKHALFTPAFFENYIKGTPFEEEFFYGIDQKDLVALNAKGFDIDELYVNFYQLTLKKLNSYYPEYEGGFFQILSDPVFAPYTKTVSPLDGYCCEDCDGYNIYELYSDEELEGEEILVDDRLQYVDNFIRHWAEHLSPKSYSLFKKFPTDVLEHYAQQPFFSQYLALRKTNQDA